MLYVNKRFAQSFLSNFKLHTDTSSIFQYLFRYEIVLDFSRFEIGHLICNKLINIVIDCELLIWISEIHEKIDLKSNIW